MFKRVKQISLGAAASGLAALSFAACGNEEKAVPPAPSAKVQTLSNKALASSVVHQSIGQLHTNYAIEIRGGAYA